MTTQLTTEYVPVSALKPFPGNPRRGNVEAIKESLEHHGQYRPIVVRRQTNEVLAGNHTLRAAAELGWTEIAVTYVDCDAEQARRIVLVDNRSNDLAGYDSEALADLLAELPGLEGTGFDEAAVDELLCELGHAPELAGPDEPPPLPPRARTKPGDLYELGNHRLICADARTPAVHERLLDGEQAALLWTDPPYGVSYEGKTKAKLRIANDGADGLAALLADAFACADQVLSDGAPLYVASPGGPRSLAFAAAFARAGWLWRQTLIWAKDTMVLGHSDYHYQHEQLLYGFKPAEGRLGRGGAGWHGDDAQVSVLAFPKPSAAREHPTMKPPELIEAMLRNSSRRGDLVLDPFAGSGSTLVAAERTGRAARLIELDPRYCDVIVSRFERLTGERATRVRS